MSAVIRFPAAMVYQAFSWRETRRKSARFRLGWCWPTPQPLSRPLQPGFRFLRHPLPADPSARLTACFPERMNIRRETYGLTTFRDSTW